VVVNCGKQLWYSGASDANRRQNRNQATVNWVSKVQRRTQETQSIFGSGLVRLVDGDDVTDLEQSGLDRLDSVAKPRGLNDDYRVGKRRDIGAVLTRADGFDENQRVAGSIQQVNQPGGGPGKPALAAPTGHAPDKDTIVRMAIHHTNAIAEHRAASDRTRWVNGNHRYATIRSPDLAEKRGHERTLPGPGWPGHADNVSMTGQRKEGIECLESARVFVFHQGR
jgi:hypothetical protein